MSLDRRFRRLIALLACTSISLTGFALSAAPAGALSAPPATGNGDLVLVAPDAGVSIPVDELPSLAPAQPGELPPGVASASLLGPIDSLNCNTLKRENYVVTTYQAAKRGSFSGGRITLQCGAPTSHGYRHIRARHQVDWTNRMSPMRGNWDDFMDFATRQSLAAPSKYANQGGGKFCYTTPIQVRNTRGQVLKTFYPRVVISTNNRRVITSIPGGGC